MKSIRNIFSGLFVLGGFVALLSLVHAQEAASSEQSIQAATDTDVMLQALMETKPLPAADVPYLGNFYSAQHFPGSEVEWPPLPGNIFGVPVWPLGNDFYLLDDRDVDYVALTEEAAKSSPTMMSMMSRSFARSYGYGHSVYLTNSTASFAYDGSITASFGIAGGTNFVPYDILTTTNLAASIANWTWLSIGYTSNNYTFYQQPADLAFYRLAKPQRTLVIAWGNNNNGQCNVPIGLTNAIEITGGAKHTIALLNDGNVAAWGDNTYGQTNIPADLTNAVVVVANVYHNLALRADGTLAIWGKWQSNSVAFFDVNLPSGLTNITAIAAGPDYDLVVRGDGSVVAWGQASTSYTTVPTNLPPAMDVAAGAEHAAALLTNGTVTAWGETHGWGATNVPPGLSNVVAIAAGDYHTLALKADGTVVAWGAGVGSYYVNHGQSTVPTGLSNVVAIAAGGYRSVALKSDGSMVVWGDYTDPGFPVNQIIGIGSGWTHVLALRTGNTTPFITRQPSDQYAPAGQNVSFSVGAIGLAALDYQWQSNGVAIFGATNSTLTLTNVQATNQAAYHAVVTGSDGGGSIQSSNANFYLVTPPVIVSQTPLPTNQAAFFQSLLTLGVTVSAVGQTHGFPLAYQWQFNGTNVGYGLSNYTFFAINPGMYSVTVSNAAGSATASWQVNVITPGNVWAWGDDTYGESTPPTGASNLIAIAAGTYHSLAVLENGSIVQWGDYEPDDFHSPIIATPVGSPPTNANIVAVAAGIAHDLALTADGKVIQWGLTNASGLQNFPTNLTGVKAISAGVERSLALLTNGTIVDWGSFTPIFNLNQRVPADLTNVTAISCGAYHWLALRSDGTVASWGYNTTFGETNVPTGLSNVVAVAGGGRHSLALKADGTVVAWGDNTYGQCNVPAGLSNVMTIAAGDFHSLALKNDGTLVAWGDNSDGQTDAPTLGRVKLIAAGGNHNLAVIFSPLVMYPVDVSKDLLLIYNSNSQDSSNVCAYYLAHRQMVGGANVLGVACDVGEFTSSTNCNSQIVAPVLNWLTNNPTKRPQYVVLFYDIPTRVTNLSMATFPTSYDYGSVGYHLNNLRSDWQPFVTYINMNGTNDCVGYINKLEFFGTNYSPGQLIISASAGGYANTNYVLDGIRRGGPGSLFPYEDYSSHGDVVSTATNGLLAAGVSPGAIFFYDGLVISTNYSATPPHAAGLTNVAGYICWGIHGEMGADYAIDGTVKWKGNSGWWIIRTLESYNGQRIDPGQGTFMKWFAPNAFGGTNYSNTPIGASSNVEEPGLESGDKGSTYFSLWASGKNFGICVWRARNTPYFQAVGDPFVTR